MKALEVLKEIQNITFKSKECFGYEANFRFNDAYIKRLDEAIKELESLKCCQNCKHYSMFDGKVECKTCLAINHTNWVICDKLGQTVYPWGEINND